MGLGICKQAIRASAAAAARRWGIDQRTASTTRSPSILICKHLSKLRLLRIVGVRRSSGDMPLPRGTNETDQYHLGVWRPPPTVQRGSTAAARRIGHPWRKLENCDRHRNYDDPAKDRAADISAAQCRQAKSANCADRAARATASHDLPLHPHPRIGAASDKTHLNVAHAFQTEPITDFLLGNQNAAGVMHSLFCSVTTRLTAISRQRRKFERNARPPTVGAFRSRVQVASLLPFGAQFRSAVTCLIAQNVRGSPSPPAADLTHQGGWAAQQTGSVYGAGSRPRTSPYHRRQFL